jgi:hypothetical protein
MQVIEHRWVSNGIEDILTYLDGTEIQEFAIVDYFCMVSKGEDEEPCNEHEIVKRLVRVTEP